MQQFEEIFEDITWRNEQLLIAKTIPFLYDFSDDHKAFLIKYSIPTIYAVWEGFVQNSFQVYVRELNKLSLQRNDFCANLVTHSVDSDFPQLKEYPFEFDKKIRFVSKLDTYFQSSFTISPKINTQSNVELEVLNRLLGRFNLKPVTDYPYKQQLKDFLQLRNRIAHGDNSLIISNDNIEDFKTRINESVVLVESLMQEVCQKIVNGYNDDKSHLRSSET